MMTKVKICGNTNVEDARLAIDLGADYLGFIFTESKRKVDISRASHIINSIEHFQNYVAVFFNQPRQEVERIVEELDIRILQFHGEETARYCESFMKRGFTVIKTFRIKDKMSLKRLDEYNVSHFLFDAYSKEQAGGSGITFDWDVIEDHPYVHDQLFLAGGLNPDNLRHAIDRIHPFAVDVASGVEIEPGKKDPVALESFIKIAKDKPNRTSHEDSIRS